MGRKAVAQRMAVDVRATDRHSLADHVTEKAAAGGQGADAAAGVFVEARSNELDEGRPILAQYAERRVAGTDDLASRVHDFLQDVIQVVTGVNSDARGEQSLEALPNAGEFLGRDRGWVCPGHVTKDALPVRFINPSSDIQLSFTSEFPTFEGIDGMEPSVRYSYPHSEPPK